MKMMLEAGVHFGHHTRRWNPKMARYIFGERNGIHILDLQKTVKELKKAYVYMKERSQEGAKFLFVGTKKQAKDIMKEESVRCGVAAVYEKWLGGTLTNFATIRKSVKRLEELEKWEADGLLKVVSKKELSRLTKEMNRLHKLLSGIRDLSELPDIVFVIDPVEEILAVTEARKLKIPVVAVCDTNCDPDLIDVPVPGNDDAARAIKLFCSIMSDAVIEGREAAKTSKAAEAAAVEQAVMESAVVSDEDTQDNVSADALENAMSAETVPVQPEAK